PVGDWPISVDIAPNGLFAYVVDEGGDLYRIDTSNDSIANTVQDVVDWPTAVQIAPNGEFALVTDSSFDQVAKVDTEDDSTETIIETWTNYSTTSVAISPDSTFAMVLGYTSSGEGETFGGPGILTTVSKLDLVTNTIV